MHLYLIRHAESEGNVNNHIIGGQSNHLPLTERGIIQAEALGDRFLQDEIKFDAIHSSTAVRSVETVKIVGRIMGLDLHSIQFSDELLELSQGEWEGKVRTDFYTEKMLHERATNPWHFTAPGGESPKDVETRMYRHVCVNFLEKENTPHRVALFTHGMSIKCLVRRIMDSAPGMTYRTIIHNTAITHLIFQNENWYFSSLNDHAHLVRKQIGFIGHYGS